MSQIKKSASFRSRIPVRRAKPVPRRCYSPEPSSYHRQSTSTTTLTATRVATAAAGTKPTHAKHMRRITHESEFDLHGPREKVKRQRQFVADIGGNIGTPAMADATAPNGGIGPVRPKTIYSSSSFSSSDESQESEAPIQVKMVEF